ncbi:MAG: N-succinylarginine dihydrolase [Chlamydiales bacterium]|nr:N-succinylarginine dihydrolase [Chlamydiales bacterium]
MTSELNFDGIVGPTHNYSGLAFGNTASMKHSNLASNPREAALQGLAKMQLLMQMGIPQAVLPPQERPNIPMLKRIGFTGSDADILASAQWQAPQLLSACSSAASMWTANAATVSPSADSADGLLHITPANLCSHFHRSMEHKTTKRVLDRIFHDTSCFVVHDALPSGDQFADEGAANHTRLVPNHGSAGVQLFVYGRSMQDSFRPTKFPARQTLEAAQALARLHGVKNAVFAQQNPEAIDAGVFHNDVISVGNENVFFYHQKAFIDTPKTINELREKAGFPVKFIEVHQSALSLEEAVRTYLFNSQLITLPNGTMALIAPKEAETSPSVQKVMSQILESDSPIKKVIYVDLRQSMQNGGGPACLRMRVALTDDQMKALHQPILLTTILYEKLVTWVNAHYRDKLLPADLSDPQLLHETRNALSDLTNILELGSIYDFQF